MQAVKRRLSKHEKFLWLQTSGTKLWNKRRRIDSAYLLSPSTVSVPHVESRIVPEDRLNRFVEVRANTFFGCVKLLSKFQPADRSIATEEVVQRLNLFKVKVLLVSRKRTIPNSKPMQRSSTVLWRGTLAHHLV